MPTPYSAVIFDMDGVLIDSEPLWAIAANDIFANYHIHLTPQQYAVTTGLRTEEFIAHWFSAYNVATSEISIATERLITLVIEKIYKEGRIMPGVKELIHFFKEKGLKIGIASSSPLRLIHAVVTHLAIESDIDIISSAEHLPLGKPHPQVFLECAQRLHTPPKDCLVFEDSINGMIAAKAAKMQCIVIPEASKYDLPQWSIANGKLHSLKDFLSCE